MTTMTQATYGVRGLSCWRCMISAVDAVRALPGVSGGTFFGPVFCFVYAASRVSYQVPST